MITKEEYVLLTRPFDIDYISFKPGPGGRDSKIAFAHCDPRAYDDRLNEIFGNDWNVEFTVIPTNDRIISVSKLTIRGIVRSATGESLLAQGQGTNENSTTVAEAQSYKRSAVRFGLGKYLYELKDMWGNYDSQKRRFTPEAINDFRKRLNTEEVRFWTWVSDEHPDKLQEVASLIVQGETYGAIAKKLTELVYV